MKKYVDTDALIKNIVKIKDLRTLSTKTIGEAIANTPAADVVEVVKCKDCVHWCASYCTRDIKGRTNMFYMEADDFCSHGVRKEQEDK